MNVSLILISNLIFFRFKSDLLELKGIFWRSIFYGQHSQDDRCLFFSIHMCFKPNITQQPFNPTHHPSFISSWKRESFLPFPLFLIGFINLTSLHINIQECSHIFRLNCIDIIICICLRRDSAFFRVMVIICNFLGTMFFSCVNKDCTMKQCGIQPFHLTYFYWYWCSFRRDPWVQMYHTMQHPFQGQPNKAPQALPHIPNLGLTCLLSKSFLNQPCNGVPWPTQLPIVIKIIQHWRFYFLTRATDYYSQELSSDYSHMTRSHQFLFVLEILWIISWTFQTWFNKYL